MSKKQEQEVGNSIEMIVNDIVEEYISLLHDPDEIYTNNGLFNDMLKYIYKNHIASLLKNDNRCGYRNRYDIYVLDNLFNIYISLVYRYKQNKKPNLLEYSLFVNIPSDTIYNYISPHNSDRKLTPEEQSIVKSWRTTCENALINGGSVFDIFLLKSKYGYVEESAKQPIINAQNVIQVASLPDMDSLMLTNKSKDGT